jgi:hypothetical protein
MSLPVGFVWTWSGLAGASSNFFTQPYVFNVIIQEWMTEVGPKWQRPDLDKSWI